jgi:Histone-like transcription factor (CBF/NF-Y) and archaeal histone
VLAVVLMGVASEKCHQEKRKTVNGEDIIFAMTSLGFENYAEVLKIYLAKYRDVTPCSLPYNPKLPCLGCSRFEQLLITVE